MNPTYGLEIGKWVRKAYESYLRGATVVCLLPARTDTAWWHDFCLPHGKITYVRGRLLRRMEREGQMTMLEGEKAHEKV